LFYCYGDWDDGFPCVSGLSFYCVCNADFESLLRSAWCHCGVAVLTRPVRMHCDGCLCVESIERRIGVSCADLRSDCGRFLFFFFCCCFFFFFFFFFFVLRLCIQKETLFFSEIFNLIYWAGLLSTGVAVSYALTLELLSGAPLVLMCGVFVILSLNW
jgi:hypothetical protein